MIPANTRGPLTHAAWGGREAPMYAKALLLADLFCSHPDAGLLTPLGCMMPVTFFIALHSFGTDAGALQLQGASSLFNASTSWNTIQRQMQEHRSNGSRLRLALLLLLIGREPCSHACCNFQFSQVHCLRLCSSKLLLTGPSGKSFLRTQSPCTTNLPGGMTSWVRTASTSAAV